MEKIDKTIWYNVEGEVMSNRRIKRDMKRIRWGMEQQSKLEAARKD
jgi:hypothetical protein